MRFQESGFALQFLFRQFGLGNVPGDTDQAVNAAVDITERDLGGGDPGGAVTGFAFFRLAEDGLAGGQQSPVIHQFLAGFTQGEEVRIKFADRLFGVGQAQMGSVGPVNEGKPAGGVLEIDVIRQVVHERLQQVVLVIQRFLDAFAFGDVLLDRNEILNRAIFTRHRGDGHVLVVTSAILPFVDQLAVPGISSGNGFPEFGIKLLGMAARLEQACRLAQDLLSGIACETGESRIDPEDFALAVGNDDAVDGGVERTRLQP